MVTGTEARVGINQLAQSGTDDWPSSDSFDCSWTTQCSGADGSRLAATRQLERGQGRPGKGEPRLLERVRCGWHATLKRFTLCETIPPPPPLLINLFFHPPVIRCHCGAASHLSFPLWPFLPGASCIKRRLVCR